MQRRTERRREMERLLGLRAAEGLSFRELSERSGIPVGTLSWWSHELRREAAAPAFAEVRVVDGEAGSSEMRLARDPEVVMHLADVVTVELRGAAAERVVERILGRIDRPC